MSFHIPKIEVGSINELDGKLFIPLKICRPQNSDGSAKSDTISVTTTTTNATYDTNAAVENTDFEWEEVDTSHPALGGGMVDYSTGLPYQNTGTEVKKFAPSDEAAFHPVSDTAYELTEAYLAPEDGSVIKKNEQVTSGMTDSNGLFNLLYDDSATFLKQFATGSRMLVIQKDSLMKPNRYTGSLSEDTNPEAALTSFIARTDAEARNISDYYYTTVKAESKNKDNTITSAVDITYDGYYYFSKGEGIPDDDPVNITQTFTNTIKTGSLTISKELKGNNLDTYRYGFQVTFSNVFGGSSEPILYKGSYTLIEENGTETTKTATSGIIELKPNQQAVISGIPVGTTYVINEVKADGTAINDGSIVSKIQTTYVAEVEDESITSPTYTQTNTVAGIVVDKENRTISGVIPCSIVNSLYESETNEFTEVHVSVAYTNQFGSLSITKNVAGDTNNISYYYKNSNTEKAYTFKVTQKDGTPYTGSYHIYTYDYSAGANKPPKVTTTLVETTDGVITLLNGQKAEIGEIPLTGGENKQYTITEFVEEDAIFFVESLRIISGTETSRTTDNTSITTQVFTGSNPTFDVAYSNRYSNAYIQIDKYFDKLYYNEMEYADGLTYQYLTDSQQSFLFKVKQYKTLEDAMEGNNNYEDSFEVILNTGDHISLLPDAVSFEEKEYSHMISKTVRVLGNRYYRIEEDTNWSWKYQLHGVATIDDFSADSQTLEPSKAVILKSHLDIYNNLEEKEVPIAKFYNYWDTSKETIDGDTGNVVNKIEKN